MSDDRANEPEIDMTGGADPAGASAAGPAREAGAAPGPDKDAGASQESDGTQKSGADAESAKDAGPEQGAKQDAGTKQDAGAQQDAKQDAGSDKDPNAAPGGGADDEKAKKAGHDGDERAKGDAEYDKNREQVFAIYKESLEIADWGYKPKTGVEREVGHQSVVLAERGYVAAGLYDKEEADKLYEQATGKPPKPELQQRLLDAKGVDPANGIADMSAGLGVIKEKQKLWSLTLDKNQIEKQMSNWEVAIGDAAERKRNHQRAVGEELLKPERPGQGDDSGLDMFMRSLKGGYKAGKDWKMASAHKTKEKDLKGNISESLNQHGDLVKSLAKFSQEQGDGVGETKGPNGRNGRRFSGIRDMVANTLKSKGRKSAESTMETGAENAKKGGFMDAMMRRQRQDQGING